jgi:Protein of unknown function (DUF1003)
VETAKSPRNLDRLREITPTIRHGYRHLTLAGSVALPESVVIWSGWPKDPDDTNTVPATKLNRLALWIALRVGSMGLFVVIFLWTVIWLSWNVLAPKAIHFDPFPGFVLWLLISNMIQLFLMPLILIGQNLQAKESDRRAKND